MLPPRAYLRGLLAILFEELLMPLPAVPALALPVRVLALLHDIARQRTLAFRLVVRAQLFLACVAGTPIKQIARSFGRDRNNVRTWRRRWAGCVPALRSSLKRNCSDAISLPASQLVS